MDFTNVVIDSSHHQDPVDFAQVKESGIAAVICKASTGKTGVDATHNVRRPAAKGTGLLWGSYHFGTGVPTGVEQARHFLSTVGSAQGDLVALDFEKNVGGTVED